jgi:hypothetical protein
MAVILVTTTESYIGESTDTKPSDPPAGSTFYETDTGSTYIFTGTAWILKA